MGQVTRYRAVAVLGLIGAFISAYLLLYSLGYYGVLMCGTGSCEVVQTSEYAVFLGIPVPGWGVAWYGAMTVMALVMASGRPETSGPGRVIALLATAGLAFSIYLSALEAFVLDAWCRWCIASALLTVAIFLFVAPWKQLRGGPPESLEGIAIE